MLLDRDPRLEPPKEGKTEHIPRADPVSWQSSRNAPSLSNLGIRAEKPKASPPVLGSPVTIWVCSIMGGGGGRATGVGISGYVSQVYFGVCFRYVSGMFRGTLQFWGYVTGYISGYVSRVCNLCALLKPEPPKPIQTHMTKRAPFFGLATLHGNLEPKTN